jgi:hypothetical protein
MSFINLFKNQQSEIKQEVCDIFSTKKNIDELFDTIIKRSLSCKTDDFPVFFRELTSYKHYDKIFAVNPEDQRYSCAGFYQNGIMDLKFPVYNFIHRSNYISQFVALQSAFDKEYFFKNYKKCYKILNNIDGIFGESIISTLLRVKCKYKELDEKSVTSFCNNYKKNLKNQLIGFMLEAEIVKQESRSIDNAIVHYQEIFSELRATENSWLATFISIFLVPLEYDSGRVNQPYPASFPGIALNDQYYIFKNAIVDNYTVGSIMIDDKSINDLRKNIQDDFWSNFSNLVTKNTSKDYRNNIKTIVDEYSSGNYKQCIKLINDEIQIGPDSTSLIDLNAKCNIYYETKDQLHTHTDTYFADILEIYKKIILVNSSTGKNIDALESILITHFPVKWTLPVYTSLYCLFPDYSIDNRIISCKRLKANNIEATPLLNSADDRNFKLWSYSAKASDTGPSKTQNTGKERGLKSYIKKLLKEDNLNTNEIENKFKALELSNIKFYHEFIRLKVEYYIRTNNLIEALRLVTDRCIECIEEFRCYPISTILDLVKDDCEVTKEVAYPILAHIYTTKVDKRKSNYRDNVYENFVEQHNTHKPSDIYSPSPNLSHKELYFIEKICIPSIMDTSPFWNSNDELIGERIKLLNLLIHHNPKRSSIYTEERIGIINSTIVEKSRAEIDNCKIHVDISALRTQKEQDYKELYESFIAANDEENPDAEDFVIILDGELMALAVPKGDKNNVVQKIVRAAIRDFVYSHDFGLDKYLSTDIRHQVFITLIRSNLRNHNLITDRNDESYEENIYWLEKYNYFGRDICNKLNLILNEFAYSFDDKLLEANNWLKVTTSHLNDKHLFKYSVDAERFDSLKSDLSKTEDFDQFFDTIIALMWEMTEENIEKATERLNENFKHDIMKLFEKLNNDIEKLELDFRGLKRSINLAQNCFVSDIATVSRWLVRRTSGYLGSLDMRTIVEVAKSSFETLNHGEIYAIDEDVDSDLELLKVTEKEARALVRGLTMLFDNAYRYGSQNNGKNISIKTVHKNNDFKATISNSIDIKENTDPQEMVRELNKTIHDKSKSVLVRQEGKSGLYKINDFLNKASSRFSLEVSFTSPNIFNVSIKGVL